MIKSSLQFLITLLSAGLHERSTSLPLIFRFFCNIIMKIQTIAFVLIVVAATSNAEFSGILGNFKGFLGDKGAGLVKTGLKLVTNFIGNLKLTTKDGKPDFCAKYECPSYTVKNKTDNYELRCYSGALWASTKGYGYRKLFRSFKQDLRGSPKGVDGV